MPASAFWRELAARNPDAVIVLSVRDSAEQWWDSWSHTIAAAAARKPAPGSLFVTYGAMTADLFRTQLGAASPGDKAEMVAVYERHNDAVRAGPPPARLPEWRAADGWAPLADRLGVPVPDEPFPRVRDPLRYYVSVFGDPAAGEWGWRFAGHHLSLSHAISGGELISATSSFFGADPAEAPLPGGGSLRPCAALEDLGRELVRSLDEGLCAAALLARQAPPDIVTGNRPALDGRLWVPRPRERFRDASQVPGAVLDALEARMSADEQVLGPAAIEALSWSSAPAGVPWSRLRGGQREILIALLRAYLGRLPEDTARAEQAKITGEAAGQLHFAWAGSAEPGRPHYYRIQGPRVLAEYDNTQRDANHIHAVWRDPSGDFGRNVLADHYATTSH